MKNLIVCALFLSVLAVAWAKPKSNPGEKYTTKYDNVDLDEILQNKRLLNNYVNCLLEKGNCTPDGAELKKVLPDALATDCAKCSKKQQDGSKKVLTHLLKREQKKWSDVEEKYDPKGGYRKRFCVRAKNEGLDVGTACD